MDLILGTYYQIKKAKKAHEYLRYDAPDGVRLGHDALGKGLYYGSRMAGLGIGYGVAVTPYTAYKLVQSLYYVGVEGIDLGVSVLAYGGSKLLRNIPGTNVETKDDLYGWAKCLRPSRQRTVEGWTPYGFRAQVPGPDRCNGGAPRPGGWWGFNMRPPWGYLQAPEWQWENPELPVREAHRFDPTKQSKGMQNYTPKEWIEFNKWVSKVMIDDAQAMQRLIRTECYPTHNPDGGLHPQAGQYVFTNRRLMYKAAMLKNDAQSMYSYYEAAKAQYQPNHPTRRLYSQKYIFLSLRAEAAAREAGFESADDAVDARDFDMDRLLEENAMNFNNILQRKLECEEVQHTLKLILEMHDKDLYYTWMWGYLGYDSANKSGAEKADNRLRGLLQEVDPLWGRKQGTPVQDA